MELTAITGIDYDETREKLFVRFDGGEAYLYVGVPPGVHRSFAQAESQHSFFYQEIRDCYPFNRLPA